MEEAGRPAPRNGARVVARKQNGGTGDERRRIFQRHLWLFLLVNAAVFGLDRAMGPGLQFWHWVGFFSGIFLLIHAGGLLSRGFTPAELLIPPRSAAPIADDAPPLEYQLLKSRQLRDGVARAASAVREREPHRVDEAVAAADRLETAVRKLVSEARARGVVEDPDGLDRLEDELDRAVEVLDAIHSGLIRGGVMGEPLDESLPLDAARAESESLEGVRREIGGSAAA